MIDYKLALQVAADIAYPKKTRQGQYYDITNEEYHSGPGLSRSQLETARSTMTNFLWCLAAPPKPSTPALAVGSAFHTLVLEPERFEVDVMIALANSRAAKAYKELVADHPATTVILEKEGDMIARMAEAVHKHELASSLIREAHEREISMYWVDEETGIQLRCRIDALHTECIVDLKSAASGDPWEFAKSAGAHGYHRQCAIYTDGLIACGLQPRPFHFIVVEKGRSHNVGVYTLGEESLAAGRRQYRAALRRVHNAIKNPAAAIEEVHSGYGADLITIDVPKWEL